MAGVWVNVDKLRAGGQAGGGTSATIPDIEGRMGPMIPPSHDKCSNKIGDLHKIFSLKKTTLTRKPLSHPHTTSPKNYFSLKFFFARDHEWGSGGRRVASSGVGDPWAVPVTCPVGCPVD